MKRLLLLSLTGLVIHGEITYPVDVENDRFTVILGDTTKRRLKWPRADGMQISGAPTNLIILQEIIAPAPSFDPDTEKLVSGTWTDDTNAQTATFNLSVTNLTQEELDIKALFATNNLKKAQLINQINTLRSWSTNAENTTVTAGNAVATLQVVVDRLGIFFDRFADLIEVQIGVE